MEEMEKLEEWAEAIIYSHDPYNYEKAREMLIREMRKNTGSIAEEIKSGRASFSLVSAVSECVGEYTSLTGDGALIDALSLWLEREKTRDGIENIALYVEDAKRTYSSIYAIQ